MTSSMDRPLAGIDGQAPGNWCSNSAQLTDKPSASTYPLKVDPEGGDHEPHTRSDLALLHPSVRGRYPPSKCNCATYPTRPPVPTTFRQPCASAGWPICRSSRSRFCPPSIPDCPDAALTDVADQGVSSPLRRWPTDFPRVRQPGHGRRDEPDREVPPSVMIGT